jgi:predicted nucleic acid-binding protein
LIALDTSALIDYLGGSSTPVVAAVDLAFSESQACLPPVVLSELLSDPKLTPKVTELLLQILFLETRPGFWERAGRLRAAVLGRSREARRADTLIAQACIDHDTPLVASDADFKVYEPFGLVLRP